MVNFKLVICRWLAGCVLNTLAHLLDHLFSKITLRNYFFYSKFGSPAYSYSCSFG